MCNMMWWVDFGAYQSSSIIPPPRQTEGINMIKKLLGQGKDRDISQQLT